MAHTARLICKSCSQRLAAFDAGSLDVSSAVRVTIPPTTIGQSVTIVLVCPCGARRPWIPGALEVKAGGDVARR